MKTPTTQTLATLLLCATTLSIAHAQTTNPNPSWDDQWPTL